MLRIHLLNIFNIKTPQALAAHTLIARPFNPEDADKWLAFNLQLLKCCNRDILN